VRYFLDTEYNGWRGALLSLALVPADGGEEFYVTIDHKGSLEPWVKQNVVPFLNMVPDHLLSPSVPIVDAAYELSRWLTHEHEVHRSRTRRERTETRIVADWPEDIAQFCSLVVIGPGRCVDVPPITFELLSIPGFSTAANSRVPHNALHDARALRDHVLAME